MQAFLLWKWVLFALKYKIISMSLTLHLALLWNRGMRRLRNGLISLLVMFDQIKPKNVMKSIETKRHYCYQLTIPVSYITKYGSFSHSLKYSNLICKYIHSNDTIIKIITSHYNFVLKIQSTAFEPITVTTVVHHTLTDWTGEQDT